MHYKNIGYKWIIIDDDTVNHIYTFLYSCNNITLKMTGIPAETCW